jgi:two-component system sensor histidine kinase/response regulator
MMRKDGSRFWAHLSIKAVEPGNPKRGLVSIIGDITPEREAFNALAKAKALAEEAARTKADFVANMSHEIRTPMTAILSFTHRLQRSGLNPRQRDYLRKVRVAAEHLLTIINDVLDFSKIEAGKMRIEHVRFELPVVLSNVSSMVQELCGKGLDLLVDVLPDVPTHLLGDPARLTQVLANYVSNAVKFSEHGNIVIRVEKLGTDRRHFSAFRSVTPALAKLTKTRNSGSLRVFQQADGSISRKYGGTGLGLVISKRIATLLGGEVGVDSTPGQGSTFWFTARLSVLDAEALPLASISTSRQTFQASRGFVSF